MVIAATTGGVGNIEKAVLLAGVLFLLDAGGIIVRNLGGHLGDLMATKLNTQLSTKYYEHLLRLPQQYYDNELTGTIISRLNRAITEVTHFLQAFSNQFFQMLLTAVFTIIIVATYSLPLALLVFSVYPIFGWLTTRTSKKWQVLQHKKNHEIDTASGRFAEVISQIRVAKSYVTEKVELGHFTKRFTNMNSINKVQSRYWHAMDVARGGVLAVIFFAIYLIIFTQTVQGQFTVGEMVLLITLINAVRMPLQILSYIVDSYQRAATGSHEFVSVMMTKPAIADTPSAKKLQIQSGAVEFKDVFFSYNEGKPILQGISFAMNPDEKVALVGESGEGKSTITNLLMRLYEPDSGAILIDGVNIKDVTQASLRKNIATVFQDPALFSGTVRENIAYGRPDASIEDIVEAAKAANADEFIAKFKDDYESVVGERGVKLSGGQKQRISIARALLKDAPILILDEATSSLDSRSELLVQTALDRLMKGRTTLIIAHRLSTIAHVDRIVTLKNGRIDEIGSPRELSNSGGIYSNLLSLQKGIDGSSREKLKRFDISN